MVWVLAFVAVIFGIATYLDLRDTGSRPEFFWFNLSVLSAMTYGLVDYVYRVCRGQHDRSLSELLSQAARIPRPAARIPGHMVRSVARAVIQWRRGGVESPWTSNVEPLIGPLGWLCASALLAIWALGTWLELGFPWLPAFLVSALILHALLLARLQTVRTFEHPAWRSFGSQGQAVCTVTAFIIAFWLFGRTERVASFSVLTLSMICLLCSLSIGVLSERPFALIAKGALAILVLPLVSVYFVLSLIHGWVIHSEYHGAACNIDSPTARRHAAVRAQRERLLREWQGRGGPVIAVTLSGGGYRAALTHAGVLAVLDEARIPIKILSTVSGGSIIGGSYSIGWSPEEFKEALRARRPGLSAEIVTLQQVLYQTITLGSYGSGDVLANHLWRRFFCNRTLEDTGPPDLLVNTTSYTGERHVFWKHGWWHKSQWRGSAHLSRVVAASGAFPVAFTPAKLGEILHVDGGLVENLGIDGLRYFAAEGPSESIKEADVLLISDVSADPPQRSVRARPFPHAAALNAIEITYHSLHQRIYERLSGGSYSRSNHHLPEGQAYTVGPGVLWPDAKKTVQVIILGPTAETERKRFESQHERDLVERVARISTLHELWPREVDAAFWLGKAVATAYLPSLCRAIRLADCPDIPLSPPPPLP